MRCGRRGFSRLTIVVMKSNVGIVNISTRAKMAIKRHIVGNYVGISVAMISLALMIAHYHWNKQPTD